ncbi:Lrp/AsnC family transcriptional regulator [Candidatus Pacearchaeota archaeon]|nr:Lrp/AsnC family transcriptional regulator [Candidatus Pacearchaeota archaeon]
MKLLIEDAKLSDTSIANKMNISSQAVGKIRKKLEDEVIKGYTIDVDLEKLDINLFSLSKVEIAPTNERTLEMIKEKILDEKTVISFMKSSGGLNEYFISGGFRDMTTFQDFFQKKEKERKISEIIKVTETNFFPTNSIYKNSQKDLIIGAIDKLGTKTDKTHWNNNTYLK